MSVQGRLGKITSQKHKDFGADVEFICWCVLGTEPGQNVLLGFIYPGMELP